jgi:hypothetical protein
MSNVIMKLYYEIIDALFPLLALPPPLRCCHLACLRHHCRRCRHPHRAPLRCCFSLCARASPLFSCVCKEEGLVGHSSGSGSGFGSGYCQPQRGPCSLLRLPHRHEHDAVTLHVPITLFISYPVLRQIIVLLDSSGSARALSLKPHHLPLAPEEPIQWAHILSLHLQRRVVPSDDASVALTVILANDFF